MLTPVGYASVADGLNRFRDINTVKLIVGASKNVFNVHEDILFNSSPVFKAAFDSDFKEGTERTMELPDEDVDLFDHFVSWLYSWDFDHKMFDVSAPDTKQRFQEHFMKAAHLFVFADKYDIGSLRISICDDLFDLSSYTTQKDADLVPSSGLVDYVYANTQRKAIIRVIIADWFAWIKQDSWQPDGETADWIYTIPDLGVDLAFALYELSETSTMDNPFEGNKAEYMQKLQEKRGAA